MRVLTCAGSIKKDFLFDFLMLLEKRLSRELLGIDFIKYLTYQATDMCRINQKTFLFLLSYAIRRKVIWGKIKLISISTYYSSFCSTSGFSFTGSGQNDTSYLYI